mgnify:CR=1 FL=1
MQKILAWDWPVRIGHWLMVGGFILAWLTSESESLRLVHALAGATVMAVAAFRLVWGVIGTRTARFSDFVRGPAAVRTYLLGLLRLQPAHFTGHNPAGGWAILLLLGFALLAGASGWAIYNDLGGHWLEELHEGLAALMLLVVFTHLAGVISGSVLHGENLVRAMLSGYKAGPANEAIASARPLAAGLLLAWTGAAVWWLVR